MSQIPLSFFTSLAPSGAVMAFAGTTAPTGWLLCDGSAISRTTYSNLFSSIGVAHGIGDGSTTFRLPDYRGRFLRGVASGSTNDPDRASRTAANTGGNTGDSVGSVQADQFGSHSHSSSLDIGGNLTNGNIGTRLSTGISFGQTGTSTTNPAIASNGGNESRPKNANVNYIIKI